MEDSRFVMMLDTSSKDSEKLPTSSTSDGKLNAYRLLSKRGYNAKSQGLLGKLPQEAFRENGNSSGLGCKCSFPIRRKIKRAST